MGKPVHIDTISCVEGKDPLAIMAERNSKNSLTRLFLSVKASFYIGNDESVFNSSSNHIPETLPLLFVQTVLQSVLQQLYAALELWESAPP